MSVRIINWMECFPLIFVLLFAAACSTSENVKTDREVCLNSPIREYSEIYSSCSRIINDEPNNYEAYLRRGYALCSIPNYPSAIADFTKAIEINPQKADGYDKRGLCHFDNKKYEPAIADFT